MKTRLAFLLLSIIPPLAPAEEPPNILLIMADDLGWFDTRFQGNESLETPHLDRFVKEGMLFTDGYAAAPVCTPTRAAMMTGMSPARLGITNHAPGHKPGMVPEGRTHAGAENRTYLPLEATTIAERLKNEAGYATGFVGKWHLSHRKGKDEDGNPWEPRLRPEFQGYDLNIGGCDRGGPPSYFDPYRIPALAPRRDGEYLPARLADECIAFLEANREGPFFLTFWNYSVHYPIEAPAELIGKYKERGIKNPAYAAMIEGMDRSIGRVLQSLDDLDVAGNTLVIFTSDNGSLFGNGPLRANKGHLYEGGIRVPWAIRWPGKVRSESRSDAPIISTDVFPTLLEVANLEPGPDLPLDGESLVPLITGNGNLKRKSLFFHYPNYAFHKRNRLGGAIRKGDFKLIRFYDDDSVELYDLKSDPGEKRNLAAANPETARELREELNQWLRDSGARMPIKVASEN
ncbi:MAG: sulfatase [Akkermansiaceae bacterium]|nr:sulfatase [Akkermansiaceae bacterium]NNM29087.1 sulfatase [Akkermansiaceae bacterium]